MPEGRSFQKFGQEEENTPLVTILETKVDDKTARAQDKRGSLYTIRLDKASFGGIHYPVPGSRWYVKKIANEWVLMARGFYQNPQLGYDLDPQPGDTFIGGEGTTYVVGDFEVLGSGGGGGADPLDIYPIDSIYLTLSASFDPNVTFGGTWVNLENRFLVGAGDTYSAGDTGGATTHTLAEANLPAHTHGTGTLAAANESSHTHGVGTYDAAAESSHTHGVGSYDAAAESTHTHGVGSYDAAAEASHTHGAGTYATGDQSVDHTHNIGRDHDAAGGAVEWVLHSTGISGAESTIATSGQSASHTHSVTTGSSAAGSSHDHALSGTSAAGSSHDHALSGTSAAGSSHDHALSGTSDAGSAHTHSLSGSTGSTGSGTAVNHLPPYLAVFMWRRTA